MERTTTHSAAASETVSSGFLFLCVLGGAYRPSGPPLESSSGARRKHFRGEAGVLGRPQPSKTGVQETARSCSKLLEAARGCSKLLDTARGCSKLLEAARSCSKLLGAARNCSKLLETA
eukprot:3944066-Alexandrium_andersonii.AAC.1